MKLASLVIFLHQVLAAHADRQAARRQLRDLLAKPNDRLIRDIGLTRDDLHKLANLWAIPEPPSDPRVKRSARTDRADAAEIPFRRP